ncbi:hypothetical protein Tco_0538971, partial [Tanacetum coccineum]
KATVVTCKVNNTTSESNGSNVSTGTPIGEESQQAAATATGLNHNSNRVDTTILGMSVTSKGELIGLVEKIEAGALDDEIYGLTTDEREATHALILDLTRGFNYANSI